MNIFIKESMYTFVSMPIHLNLMSYVCLTILPYIIT